MSNLYKKRLMIDPSMVKPLSKSNSTFSNNEKGLDIVKHVQEMYDRGYLSWGGNNSSEISTDTSLTGTGVEGDPLSINVITDATLTGNGTLGDPLSVVPGEFEAEFMEDVTYAELMAAIGASELIPRKYYRITDYSSEHYAIFTTDPVPGVATEVLIAQALTDSTLNQYVISETHPTDIIKYNPSRTTYGKTKGTITSRATADGRIVLPYDFRNIKSVRWNDGGGNYIHHHPSLAPDPGDYQLFDFGINPNLDIFTSSSIDWELTLMTIVNIFTGLTDYWHPNNVIVNNNPTRQITVKGNCIVGNTYLLGNQTVLNNINFGLGAEYVFAYQNIINCADGTEYLLEDWDIEGNFAGFNTITNSSVVDLKASGGLVETTITNSSINGFHGLYIGVPGSGVTIEDTISYGFYVNGSVINMSVQDAEFRGLVCNSFIDGLTITHSTGTCEIVNAIFGSIEGLTLTDVDIINEVYLSNINGSVTFDSIAQITSSSIFYLENVSITSYTMVNCTIGQLINVTMDYTLGGNGQIAESNIGSIQGETITDVQYIRFNKINSFNVTSSGGDITNNIIAVLDITNPVGTVIVDGNVLSSLTVDTTTGGGNVEILNNTGSNLEIADVSGIGNIIRYCQITDVQDLTLSDSSGTIIEYSDLVIDTVTVSDCTITESKVILSNNTVSENINYCTFNAVVTTDLTSVVLNLCEINANFSTDPPTNVSLSSSYKKVLTDSDTGLKLIYWDGTGGAYVAETTGI